MPPGIGRANARSHDCIPPRVRISPTGKFAIDCNDSTQWYRSQHIGSWSNAPTTLLSQARTGLCGPGGADVTGSRVSGQDRIFLHGWINAHGAPAPDAAAEDRTGATRGRYAAVLDLAADGFTPQVGAFLSP